MTAIRVMIYTHCLFVSALVGLTVFALDRRSANDWRFDRQLRSFVDSPVGTGLVWVLITAWYFPSGFLALMTRGKMRAWRRWVIVVEDTMLGLVQVAALVLLICAVL
jgi:hypothetical protein